MPNPVQTNLQVGNAAMGTVSRQPQTTDKSVANAPFVRLSRKAQTRGFKVAGEAFGGFISETIKPAGGYLSALSMTVTASGGVDDTPDTTLNPDGPWNVIANILFRDPLGTTIIQTDGFGLYLINLYSGQCGEGLDADPTQLPSYNVSDIANGNFSFRLLLPLELDSAAYCSLSSLNAAAESSIDITLASAATVYADVPATTVPTLTVEVNQPFWAVPSNDASLAPPDAGASAQWTAVKGNQSVTTGEPADVICSRVGTWMHTLICTMRDNTGARVDSYGTQTTLQVDGVPLLIEKFSERVDKMAKFTDGISRPVGVIAYTWRDAVKPVISNADTHDLLLKTTPATLLELLTDGATIANSPATVQFLVGQLFPVNAERIPYTHLAQ